MPQEWVLPCYHNKQWQAYADLKLSGLHEWKSFAEYSAWLAAGGRMGPSTSASTSAPADTLTPQATESGNRRPVVTLASSDILERVLDYALDGLVWPFGGAGTRLALVCRAFAQKIYQRRWAKVELEQLDLARLKRYKTARDVLSSCNRSSRLPAIRAACRSLSYLRGPDVRFMLLVLEHHREISVAKLEPRLHDCQNQHGNGLGALLLRLSSLLRLRTLELRLGSMTFQHFADLNIVAHRLTHLTLWLAFFDHVGPIKAAATFRHLKVLELHWVPLAFLLRLGSLASFPSLEQLSMRVGLEDPKSRSMVASLASPIAVREAMRPFTGLLSHLPKLMSLIITVQHCSTAVECAVMSEMCRLVLSPVPAIAFLLRQNERMLSQLETLSLDVRGVDLAEALQTFAHPGLRHLRLRSDSVSMRPGSVAQLVRRLCEGHLHTLDLAIRADGKGSDDCWAWPAVRRSLAILAELRRVDLSLSWRGAL